MLARAASDFVSCSAISMCSARACSVTAPPRHLWNRKGARSSDQERLSLVEIGAVGEIRTRDLKITNQLLCQLSYDGGSSARRVCGGQGGWIRTSDLRVPSAAGTAKLPHALIGRRLWSVVVGLDHRKPEKDWKQRPGRL